VFRCDLDYRRLHKWSHGGSLPCYRAADELDRRAKINVLADRQADAIYKKPTRRTGLFPSWIPGTRAALFHGEQQVTKGTPSYIRDAAHTPVMKDAPMRQLDVKSHGTTPRTSPSIGAIMESPSKNYLTGDASRFQSTPTTCSPPNDDFRLSTIVSMYDALPAISYGRTPPTC
jgi:hypothetical protein